MVRSVLVALLMSLFAAGAGSAWAGEVSVQTPWARATARSAPSGVVYFTVRNTGSVADRLLSAASPAAETAELHTHKEEDGVLMMRAVDGVDIPAGATVALQPGGLHVMLIGLAGALKEGRTVPLALTFEKAGTIRVEASILAPGARGPK